ncbi:AH receptor-interacting protein-like [Tubulanus polymorphus]|uniref:AH receptor-interacting protein-like n=1 Tax=Tubulanus polymorphus TaxID=672921 RepID=UPI003DA32BAD
MTSESDFGISKKIVYAGKPSSARENGYVDGTKLTFHYQTRKCDEEKTVLDDTKKYCKPMELILGKKFKLEVWEACLKTMNPEEVSTFTVDKSLVQCYPTVAKSLRDYFSNKKAEERKHCCGMMSMAEQGGLGYCDLDDLMKNPIDLEFTLELVKVEEPGDYRKEAWSMNEDEKIDAIPKLKEEGNLLYKEKKYKAAADVYAEAIGMLEQLLLREKPHDVEWNVLNEQKLPFLLNYSQCKLLLNEYYPTIQHTTEALEIDPKNVKAYFRRAKAHAGVWNFKEAREDFDKVCELDPSLKSTVKTQMLALAKIEKEKEEEEKLKLQGKMFS